MNEFINMLGEEFPDGMPNCSQEDGVALMLIRRKEPGPKKKKFYDSLSVAMQRYVDENIAFFGKII